MRPFLCVFVVSFALLIAAPSFGQCLLPGGYGSTPTLSYSCAVFLGNPLISWSIQRWDFTVNGSSISVNPFPGTNPPTLIGMMDCQTGVFSAVGTVLAGPGGCTETYTLTGQAQASGLWTGTFRAQYTGTGCDDYAPACLTQVFDVSGALPPTDVGLGTGFAPALVRLDVAPNPFSSVATLRLHLDQPLSVDLVIRDVTGRAVVTILHGEALGRGDHALTWNRRTAEGRLAAVGVYFAHVRAGSVEHVTKLLVVD